MAETLGDEFGEELHVPGKPACHPGRAGRNGELAWIDGRLRVAPVGGFGLVSGQSRRRHLAFGQAVDLVVHQDVGDIEVSASYNPEEKKLVFNEVIESLSKYSTKTKALVVFDEFQENDKYTDPGFEKKKNINSFRNYN